MNASFRRHNAARRGLTLIELVVVLAILVALAGLIIGNFPGLIKRASRSSSASSVGDINRAVQVDYTTLLKYPNDMDSLLQSGGTVYANLPNVGGTPVGGLISAGALTSAEVNALASVGITRSFQMDVPTPTDVTWKSTDSGTALFNGAAGANLVATISSNTAYATFGPGVVNTTADGGSRYLVFGLGNRCTLVGPSKNMFEAPVRFGESAAHNPKDYYQRYALVFALDAVGTATKVRYVGSAAIEATGLSVSDGNLQQYWQN